MTATEIISRTAEAAAAFEEKKAVMMQSLVDRTMEVMRKQGIHVPSDWRIPVAAAKINVEPEIPVTEEMIADGEIPVTEEISGLALSLAKVCGLSGIGEQTATALRALIERDRGALASEWRAALTKARKETQEVQHLGFEIAKEARAHITALEAEKSGLQQAMDILCKSYLDEIKGLKADIRMLMSDKVGDHDYHGPVKDGKAVPDESHERFHGSIGDVLSGNIIRPARDQMEKALADARAKDGKGVPSIPTGGRSDDPRRIGG